MDQALPESGKMAVSFDKAGHGKAAFKIKDFSIGPTETGNFFIGANGEDTLSLNCEGLCPRIFLIHRVQVAIGKDQVGIAGGLPGTGKNQEAQYQGHGKHSYHIWYFKGKIQHSGVFYCILPR